MNGSQKNNIKYDVVVRYVLSVAGKKGEHILGCFHIKKEAIKHRKTIEDKQIREKSGITQFIFDGSKISYRRLFSPPRHAGFFHSQKLSINKDTPDFNVRLLDFPFEVGMAIDWINGITQSIEIESKKGIGEWL